MFKLQTLHSLAKVFPDGEINSSMLCSKATMLQNEEYSFQLAVSTTASIHSFFELNIESDISDCIKVRYVEYEPCMYTIPDEYKDLCQHPQKGLFPDILQDIPYAIWFHGIETHVFWITVDSRNRYISPGTHIIKLNDITFELEVLSGEIPPQEFICTNWFHCDSLCNYYSCQFGSEEFWQIAGNFMTTAVRNGINMILTPIFTPPLDTRPGGERLTTQLVNIKKINGLYEFDFDLMKRWIEICKKSGVKYFEISHLFTQWGCRNAPKIMAFTESGYERIFGWETDGGGEEYLGFLSVFLPELIDFLQKEQIYDNCYFHISDEPDLSVAENYKKCSDFVKKFISEDKIIDALSDIHFYEEGLLKHPIPGLHGIEPFIDANIKDLWGYYCCGDINTSNRFLAFSSPRNRILGQQLFKYGLTGFLQWGYNFYNSYHSITSIDPYRDPTGGRWVPGGDTFVVYPGPDGTAIESLRLKVFHDAIQDYTVLNALALKVGKERVLEMLDQELTFKNFSEDPYYILNIREKANRMLSE